MNGRYLINEKGAVDEAAAYPITIRGLAKAQAEIWSDIGDANDARALRRLHGLSDNLRAILEQQNGAAGPQP